MSHYDIIEQNQPKRKGVVLHDIYRDSRLWKHDLDYSQALREVYQAIKDSDTVTEYYESYGRSTTRGLTGSAFKTEMAMTAARDRQHS